MKWLRQYWELQRLATRAGHGCTSPVGRGTKKKTKIIETNKNEQWHKKVRELLSQRVTNISGTTGDGRTNYWIRSRDRKLCGTYSTILSPWEEFATLNKTETSVRLLFVTDATGWRLTVLNATNTTVSVHKSTEPHSTEGWQMERN